MPNKQSKVKTYFVRQSRPQISGRQSYESIGYWDFWQKQSRIPGQDCETICGLLDSVPDKLDDLGGSEANGGSGQIMAFINDQPAESVAGNSAGRVLRSAAAAGL